MKLILLSMLLLTSCNYTIRNGYIIEDEFVELADEFAKEYSVVVKANIRFAIPGELEQTPKGNQVGLCMYKVLGNGNRNEILIDDRYWHDLSYYGKQQLLWHELGHCVMYLKHNSNMLDGRPISLMHPYQMPDSIYKKYNNEYKQQLRSMHERRKRK